MCCIISSKCVALYPANVLHYIQQIIWHYIQQNIYQNMQTNVLYFTIFCAKIPTNIQEYIRDTIYNYFKSATFIFSRKDLEKNPFIVL